MSDPVTKAQLRPDMDAVRQWAHENPDRAAGFWYVGPTHPEESARVRIGVTSDPEGARAELSTRLSHPELLDVLPMAHTEVVLRELQQRIIARYMGGAPTSPESPRVTLVGVDVLVNRTCVGVDPFEEAFVAGLLAEYGDEWITVFHRPPSQG